MNSKQYMNRNSLIAQKRSGVFATPLVVMLLVIPSAAQTARITGSVEGIVTDDASAVITNAEVRFLNTATNQARTVKSDDRGFFRGGELPVGAYELRIEHPGFAPYLRAGIILAIGQTLHFNIVLAAAGAAAAITVTDQPLGIDPSQTSMTTSVDTEKIEELPARSRNYLSFVLLAPGVGASQTATGQTQLTDSGFTFGGLRGRSNNLSIDGLDNNDEYTGSSRTELSLEIVREFQVVNNGLSAEFGGAAGGSINVVTKTGANQIHGDAFLFVQAGALNARPALTDQSGKPDLNRYRAGLALGGPLVKDRTFYYAAFEQEHTKEQGSSDVSPGVASLINQVLQSGSFPRLGTRRITTGFFPIARAETEASAKINHQLDERHSLMLRYAFTNNRETTDAFNTGGLTDASARGSRFAEDHALVGSFTSLFGTRAVGDLRFQLATRRVVQRTNDQTGPEIDINGLINFGRPYEGNDQRRENHYQTSYSIAFTQGPHLVKAGVTANHVRLNSLAADGFGAVYTFGSLADFVTGRADAFRQAFGNPARNFGVTSYGVFLPDHWTANNHVTVDLGLRYDFEQLPSVFNSDTNNFSPRIGLAYSPSSSWVLRTGYGIFYDRYVLAFLNRSLEKDGDRAFEQVASDVEIASDIFKNSGGGPLDFPIVTIRPSVFRADARLATPYSQQANLGIEHLLTKNLTASVNYLFVRGVKLSRTRNVNLLPPVVLTETNAGSLGVANPSAQQIGREVFGPGRRDPHLNDVYLLEDSASSTYHGLSLTLNRRLADEFEFSASYTFSKTIDDASDFNEQPGNPFDLRAERALSRNHQGHRFVLSALYDLPIGDEEEKGAKPRKPAGRSEWLGAVLGHIEVAPIVTIGSGRPVNPLTGVDSDGSDPFPLSSRPLGLGRNTLKTPGFATVDLRVLKYFRIGERGKLDFVVEAFNLFNRVNVSGIDPIFGSGLRPRLSFGRPIDAFNPRHLQFSIDFEF